MKTIQGKDLRFKIGTVFYVVRGVFSRKNGTDSREMRKKFQNS